MRHVSHSKREELRTCNIQEAQIAADDCAEAIAKAIVEFETRTSLPVRDLHLDAPRTSEDVLDRLPIDIRVVTAPWHYPLFMSSVQVYKQI